MKNIGLVIMLAGLIWLVSDIGSSFTSYQHQRWIWQSQNLPSGDLIPRDTAITAMREISLDLNKRQRLALLPACTIFVGGLIIYASRSVRKERI